MKTLLLGLCTGLLLWASCIKNPPLSNESEVFRQKLLMANNAFSLKLLKQTHANTDSSNAVISPFALSVALSIIANGAEGPTREAFINAQEMQGLSIADINQTYKTLLEELSASDPAVELSLASSLWVRPELEVKTAFAQINQLYYQIPLQPLDMDSGAGQTINNWVNNITTGNIQHIVDNLTEGDGMYGISSVWFNARFKQAFDSTLNTQQPFYTSIGQTIPVNMMSGRGMKYGYYADNEVKIADLPYENGSFSLTILVPADNSSLNTLINNLTTQRWDTYMNGLSYDASPNLFLPSFNVAYNTSFKPMLINIGMEVAFTDNADFSNLTDAALNIADIKQKSVFGVSNGGVLPVTGPSSNTTFSVNKPFVIAVRDKATGRIIMIGKILNPTL